VRGMVSTYLEGQRGMLRLSMPTDLVDTSQLMAGAERGRCRLERSRETHRIVVRRQRGSQQSASVKREQRQGITA
jgi:hypothetical protein